MKKKDEEEKAKRRQEEIDEETDQRKKKTKKKKDRAEEEKEDNHDDKDLEMAIDKYIMKIEKRGKTWRADRKDVMDKLGNNLRREGLGGVAAAIEANAELIETKIEADGEADVEVDGERWRI